MYHAYRSKESYVADEPYIDFDSFGAEFPDRAAEIDDDFTDGGIGGDLMDAMANIANRLGKGDVAGAADIAQRWRLRIEQHRLAGMERSTTVLKPHQLLTANGGRANGLSRDARRGEHFGNEHDDGQAYDEAWEGGRF